MKTSRGDDNPEKNLIRDFEHEKKLGFEFLGLSSSPPYPWGLKGLLSIINYRGIVNK